MENLRNDHRELEDKQRKVGNTLAFENIHTRQVEEILNEILGQRRYRENENGDLIIPLYQDKELRISSGDNHEELPKDPNLLDDYKELFETGSHRCR
ncbi:hypothetical protein L5515_019254 [Caenorhabditis briggsae]|uniref:Uncharacterized protein n=1 Tax=Caenorhabditis briggsae TaxID=6238 RepID=A0AAE9JSY0_CAEBR|nr:hypothetical protein L5515_019254 [Caenorhabditis briggsae]